MREPVVAGSGRRQGIVVLGLGNVLAGDDGVGIEVVRRLAARWGDRPEAAGVAFVDGGTLGLELLGLAAEAERLVVVDAVVLGAPPGTVTLLRDVATPPRAGGVFSAHEVGLADLVAGLRLLGRAPTMVVVAVEPARVAGGLGLSPVVAGAVPVACAAVEAEVGLAVEPEPALRAGTAVADA